MGYPNQAAPPKQPLYFVNAPVDYALIGGVSILAYCIIYLVNKSPDRNDTGIALASALLWVCNWPHFSATNYRLYHSRANIMQYPITALVIPWVIAAGVVGSFVYPHFIAPYFIKLYTIWSPYHFSGQTLGISLIYARRAGFKIGRLERFALSSFIFSTFIYITVRSETSINLNQYYNISYPGLGLPTWFETACLVWFYVTGAALLFLVGRWCLQNKRMLPPIVLLPAATQMVWFVIGPYRQSFTEFVPFFHSLQYLLIAWSMQLKEKMDLQHIAPSRQYVIGESLRWGAINILGGGTLFFLLPRLLQGYSGQDLNFATGIVVAAVQVHHFFVDGVIWKLKRTTVSSPLMVNLADLINPAPQLRKGAA